ncbi:MAG: fused response regulator/phosphatase [Exilibacterium sp.]
MQVLVVDDQRFNRALLSAYISNCGHTAIEADNGLSACKLFDRHSIDAVFMDITMPVMNGYEACRKIKESAGGKFVPIIFVTSNNDEETLAKCIAVGGDDFISKPISELILVSKLRAHQRTLDLFTRVQDTNKSLLYHKRRVEQEHKIVECIFKNSFKRNEYGCENVKYYVSPMSMFNGDILLISPSPSGGVYVLLGDFTGHGLSAAIGCLPVSDIFYSMTTKQKSVGEIAAAINKSLISLLPQNMFFCATILELNRFGDRLMVWMGGMNDMVLTRRVGKIERRIHSKHVPLGILGEEDFKSTVEVICPQPGQKLFAFTDGVVEVNSPCGEMFGEERLHSLLESKAANHIEKIMQEVHFFQGEAEQTDDISLLEISCQPIINRYNGECIRRPERQTRIPDLDAVLPWQVRLNLSPQQLRKNNVIEQIVNLIGGIEGTATHKDLIFTLVSELYGNSLEHGLLKLESNCKSSPDGFTEYYQERERRLSRLHEGEIQISIDIEPGDVNRLKLKLTDSGTGFDIENVMKENRDANHLYYGRGIALVRSLCETVEYAHGGRTVSVTYVLESGPVLENPHSDNMEDQR